MMDFGWGCFARGDNPDFRDRAIGFGPQIGNRKHRAVAGTTDGEPAFLGIMMLQIGDGKQERIIENVTCKLKRDTMLARVRRSLEIVPFELKLALMQSLLSRSIEVGAFSFDRGPERSPNLPDRRRARSVFANRACT
jgi:hypothetical protein